MFYLLVSIFCSADVKVIVEGDKDCSLLCNMYIQIFKPENKSKDIKNGWTCKLISYGDLECILHKDYDFQLEDLEKNVTKNRFIDNKCDAVTIYHVIKKSVLLSNDLYFFVFYNTKENTYHFTFLDMKETVIYGNMVFIAYEMEDCELVEYKHSGILDYNKCLINHPSFFTNTRYNVPFKSSNVGTVLMIIIYSAVYSFLIGLFVYIYDHRDSIQYN